MTLWAEAKARFDAGVVWWLETVELVQMAADQQVDRYEGDPWEEVIAPWVESQSSVSISEVLEKCLQKLQALWTQTDKNRAARCLRYVRLGALPRAARIAVGMAVQEGSVTSRFPVCSRSVPSLEARTPRQSAAVPSVPPSFVRLPCTNGGPRLDLQEQRPGTEEQ